MRGAPRQAMQVERAGAVGHGIGQGGQGGAAGNIALAACGDGDAGRAGGLRDAPVDEPEGYRHFCQHFRPAGGRCAECDKCDLYRGEDEEEVVRRAGERAEREWREREGLAGDVVGAVVAGRGVGKGAMGGMGRTGKRSGGLGGSVIGVGTRTGKWGVQEAVDWWVAWVVRC